MTLRYDAAHACPNFLRGLPVQTLPGYMQSVNTTVYIGVKRSACISRADGQEQKFLREGKLYYDATNKREREFEFEEVGSTKAAYDKLRLYNAVS